MAYMVVTLEVSKLSGWLNADATCRESKRRHGEVQAGRRQAAGDGGASRAQGKDRLQIGGRTGVERTRNIWFMVVTPEVSQLETSASKFFMLEKIPLMSVIAETSQSAMGPHFVVASVGLLLNAWTAVFRVAVLMKA